MVWTVVTVSIAKDGNWFVFNFPLASNEAIPLACPISLFIKFIPEVKVDNDVERFVILLCGISGIFAVEIWELLSNPA